MAPFGSIKLAPGNPTIQMNKSFIPFVLFYIASFVKIRENHLGGNLWVPTLLLNTAEECTVLTRHSNFRVQAKQSFQCYLKHCKF